MAVSGARARARRLLGTGLEEKASDLFCRSVLSGRPTACIVEFAPEAELSRIGAVREEVERQHVRSPRRTEVCWLNRSLRAWVEPRSIAGVAGDPAVVVVDVPRRLRPDSLTTGDAAQRSPGRNGHDAVGLRPDLDVRGRGLVVAVLDSEVATHHPALAGRVQQRGNFTVEPWGHPHSHGTALSGVIASADAAFPGVAPDVVVHNYKVLAARRRHDADDFGAALALQQSLEDGAAVALCAWGAGPAGLRASRLARAVDEASRLGLLVVTSAGNRGPKPATMSTPADADAILVVGATDLLGTRVEPYSGRGPAGHRVGPDLVAPGGTWGTDPSQRLTCALVAGGFGHLDVGTSFAAAFAAGAAVLHLASDPGLPPEDARRRLVHNAVALRDEALEAQGAGLLQIRL